MSGKYPSITGEQLAAIGRAIIQPSPHVVLTTRRPPRPIRRPWSRTLCGRFPESHGVTKLTISPITRRRTNMTAVIRVFLLLAILCSSSVVLQRPLVAAPHVTTLIGFDPAAGELPEGLAIDRRGTMYLSFPLTGDILAVFPDGNRSTHPALPAGPGFGQLGLAVDSQGTLYVRGEFGESSDSWRLRRQCRWHLAAASGERCDCLPQRRGS